MELMIATLQAQLAAAEAGRQAWANTAANFIDQIAELRVELDDANEDADEYLRQLKLSMHSNMRKRKQLKLQDAQRRSLPVPRAQRVADYLHTPIETSEWEAQPYPGAVDA